MSADPVTLRRFLAELPRVGGEAASAVVAGAARLVADRLGVPATMRGRISLLSDVEPVAVGPVPDALARPELLGPVYEWSLAGVDRQRRGAHFTPVAVAERLVDLALDGCGPGGARVIDPAAGGGAFLLAAARRLVAGGAGVDRVLDDLLLGVDVDDEAIEVARASVALWAFAETGTLRAPTNVFVADGLRVEAGDLGGPVDVVVGNPPFLNQLAASTARSGAEAAQLRRRFGSAAGGLVDSAALFLLAALDLIGDAGRVLMIQPRSMLSATDAAVLRAEIDRRADLIGLWVDGGAAFDAAVDVCAPILAVPRAGASAVRRFSGLDVSPIGEVDRRPGSGWAELAPEADAIPRPSELVGAGRLHSIAAVTAGFRDEYYAIAAAVAERTERQSGSPIVTVGMIDPLHDRRGTQPFRFAKQRWNEPVVDRDLLAAESARAAGWVSDRLVPKVLLATQTRVLEPVVDRLGELVPVTPVLSVEADPDRLELLAAVFLAPPLVASLRRRLSGTGMGRGTIRVTASQLEELPLPGRLAPWRSAAELVAEAERAAGRGAADEWRGALEAIGALMCEAYGLARDHEVNAWWCGELPPLRTPASG